MVDEFGATFTKVKESSKAPLAPDESFVIKSRHHHRALQSAALETHCCSQRQVSLVHYALFEVLHNAIDCSVCRCFPALASIQPCEKQPRKASRSGACVKFCEILAFSTVCAVSLV